MGRGARVSPRPYYDDGQAVIYHGDCREHTEWMGGGVLITDPPYGISFKSNWTQAQIVGDEDSTLREFVLSSWSGRPAAIFGPAGLATPLGARALVWHRPGSGMGDLSFPFKPDYELIHIYGDGWSHRTRLSSVLQFSWGVYCGSRFHPHEKPFRLMRTLVGCCPPGMVVDPFSGSGSTLCAAKSEGRQCIGVEIEERYCEIAAKRLAQGVLDL